MSRFIPPFLAAIVGAASSAYVMVPLLESYRDSTSGTFRPEDDHHSAPVPPLPLTRLEPGKDAQGVDLPKDAASPPPKLV